MPGSSILEPSRCCGSIWPNANMAELYQVPQTSRIIISGPFCKVLDIVNPHVWSDFQILPFRPGSPQDLLHRSVTRMSHKEYLALGNPRRAPKMIDIDPLNPSSNFSKELKNICLASVNTFRLGDLMRFGKQGYGVRIAAKHMFSDFGFLLFPWCPKL